MGPQQPVLLQEVGFKRSQVLHAALDFSSQQHDVGPVSRFLQRIEDIYQRWLRSSSSGLLPFSPQTLDTRLEGDILPVHDLSTCVLEDKSVAQPGLWREF